MNVPLCYYGSPLPLPATRTLRAGPLTLVYEAGDLRYIRLGDVEIVRRVYVAVRDRNWGTIPAALTNEQIEATDQGFCITYDADHCQGEIDFHWHAQITGKPDGTITFTMTGEARTTFQRNRIGFCVLHPIRECAGAHCRLEHSDGTVEETRFPKLVAPQNPFKDLKSLAHEVRPGLWSQIRFEGDLFETEDQRNWIDASFKTFCTPLRIPFPVTVPAGAKITQSVRLRLKGRVPANPANPAAATFTVGTQPTGSLPTIGLASATHGGPLSTREAEGLRRLQLAHLRVEWDLSRPDLEDQICRAAAEANLLGVALEAAITVTDTVDRECRRLLELLSKVRPPLGRVLLFHQSAWATPVSILHPIKSALAAYDAKVPVFAGTTANFAELNRGRPPVNEIDGLCYAIHPQEHAFDNASLVECCAAIVDTVQSARAFADGLPIAVTPIALRKRVNPYATGPATSVGPCELPPRVDVRQMSLFGAGWTLAALKYLSEAGVASTTFFETTGWLGVRETDQGCPLPAQFPSQPGMVFPLYHVLGDAAEFIGGEVLPSVSAYPLRFDGLALRRGRQMRILLANLLDQPQDVQVQGLPGTARVRVLDEDRFDEATLQDPMGFIDDRGLSGNPRDGTLTLQLRPYAYVRIDAV